QHAVPGITLRVLQALVLASRPLAEQDGRRVFAEEVGSQSPFERSAEEHGGSRILLLPAIEIAMAIAARAGQVLADLGLPLEHQATSEPPTSAGNAADSSSHWLAGAKPSRLSREVPFMTLWLILTTPRVRPGFSHRPHLARAVRCRSRSRGGTN